MKPHDIPSLRRLCIQMSAAGYGDMVDFMNMPLEEFTETVNEVVEVAKKRKKARESKIF